jgi:hypothetical protein
MKKVILILAMAMILLPLSGCCERTGPDGVKTTTAANCFEPVQDVFCNPPPLVVSVVTGAVSIIQFAVSFYAKDPTSKAFLAAVDAQAAAETLLRTGCIGATQLNNLIAWIQSSDAKQAEQLVAATEMPMAKKFKGQMVTVSPLNPVPLIDWRDSKSK